MTTALEIGYIVCIIGACMLALLGAIGKTFGGEEQ
jgi:hypothetical protein